MLFRYSLSRLSLILVAGSLFMACSKKDSENSTVKSETPDPVIQSLASVGTNSASLVCNLDSEGKSSVTERGVCYGTNSFPDINSNKVASGSGAGIFSVNIDGLLSKTVYHARAYAINAQGTFYSPDLSFTTK